MAPKKKTDDVADAKGKITKSARVVGEAAKNVSDMGSRLERLFTSDAHWGEIGQEVDDLDAEFGKEEDMMNTLKHKFEQGDVDVRVVQLGPNGSLVDVSVSDKDPRPDYASGIQAEGRINRDQALRLLSQILPGFRSSSGRDTTANSIRKMEETLQESDKILEHWKK